MRVLNKFLLPTRIYNIKKEEERKKKDRKWICAYGHYAFQPIAVFDAMVHEECLQKMRKLFLCAIDILYIYFMYACVCACDSAIFLYMTYIPERWAQGQRGPWFRASRNRTGRILLLAARCNKIKINLNSLQFRNSF